MIGLNLEVGFPPDDLLLCLAITVAQSGYDGFFKHGTH